MQVVMKLALLLGVICVTVPLTDLKGSGTSSTTCHERIAGCGQFPVSDGAMKARCKLNKGKCMFACTFSCKNKMSRSTRKKDMYVCKDNEWQLAPRGYCIADNFPVKEVRQSSTYPEMMNRLIKKLLTSSYKYLAMASFYRRADVALPGFVKLMTSLFEKEQNFARDAIAYLLERGESLVLEDINRPTDHEDLLIHLGERTGKLGLERALTETKSLNEYVLKTIATASTDPSDPHRRHFLEDGLLDYKVTTIKRLADLQHRLETFHSSEDYFIGEYRMDLELRE
ncbi:hypothetical protein EGW08_021729 [Elysia chlorotica]|uniref:Ferritin n=1 Tax=Elysia chlorotica TaxID=188477 RepID=A0A3S1AS31_ELYCH|nr:hypothetical protein EGW08_021729 [Elysia chlorotica]